ncbi:hypothetical protein [Ureibacillus galli]|uniref:hypothetical protein n=1 Tax=Ureibacillus galli TaxID=2762222 RepID=UPI00296B5395|nr:hypothetical protein [Ureibacillus galli]
MISDDSHTSQKESSNKREKQFQEGNTLGIFYIPRLDREIPIIEGTDEDELAQGVGHFSSTGGCLGIIDKFFYLAIETRCFDNLVN